MIFKIVIPIFLENMVVLKKNYILGWVVMGSKNTEKCKFLYYFSPNLNFRSFLDTLTNTLNFLIFFSLKYIIFQRFWYKDFEDRLKTPLIVFFKKCIID